MSLYPKSTPLLGPSSPIPTSATVSLLPTTLTGDRPTGPLHLGHYVGSLLTRLELQRRSKQHIMVADMQALTDNVDNIAKIQSNMHQVVSDYLAVGLDPEQNIIFQQSKIPELAELTIYFLNLVTLSRLKRNPTLKQELKQLSKHWDLLAEPISVDETKSETKNENFPVGFLCYPIAQAADIALFKADIVPVGQDQLPMIEQCNEITEKFNRIYKSDYFPKAKAHLSITQRLLGLDGKHKMSKSLNNAIYLQDNEEVLKQKVRMMYTDPGHIKVSDPGKVIGNMVFTYLDVFYPDQEHLVELKAHYTRGGLGDVYLKDLLYHSLNNLLIPVRERRAKYTPNLVQEILIEGTDKAQRIAKEHLAEIRAVMGF